MTDSNLENVSDDALGQALHAGEAAAANELARRYWTPICRFCAALLGDPQLGEDVTQETFAKLVDDKPLPNGAVKPWLYRLARNRCLDLLRRANRSPTRNRILTGFDAGRLTTGPLTRAQRAERQRLLHEIIVQMPDEYRAVLVLKFFEGLSRTEMAEALGITEAAVKGRLVRATQALHEELRKLTGAGE